MRYMFAALAIASSFLVVPERAFALEEIGDDDGGGDGPGAGGRRAGVGIMIGEPSALTGKLFLDSTNAIQLHLGYAFGRKDKLVLIVDYLFHINGVIPPIERAGRLTPYVGLGGRIGIHDDNDAVLGVRLPLGFSFMVNNVPLEVFIEFAFGLGLIPKTTGIFDAGLGVRYYF